MGDVNSIYTKRAGIMAENNNVCIVRFSVETGAGYALPMDTIINVTADKLIAQSQILDGVAVFERVTRKPMQIEFDFTMRAKRANNVNVNISAKTTGVTEWVFPLEETAELIQKVWLKDSVLTVDNVYLNKLGVKQVIVNDIQITTIRGKTDVPVRLKCTENFYSTKQQGTTLII